jgi:hypothetical protein
MEGTQFTTNEGGLCEEYYRLVSNPLRVECYSLYVMCATRFNEFIRRSNFQIMNTTHFFTSIKHITEQIALFEL